MAQHPEADFTVVSVTIWPKFFHQSVVYDIGIFYPHHWRLKQNLMTFKKKWLNLIQSRSSKWKQRFKCEKMKLSFSWAVHFMWHALVLGFLWASWYELNVVRLLWKRPHRGMEKTQLNSCAAQTLLTFMCGVGSTTDPHSQISIQQQSAICQDSLTIISFSPTRKEEVVVVHTLVRLSSE